ncbi:TPA_asm: P3 [Fraxinus gammacytorhabdovirus 2]|nr:TPA_asm: P3 [Fraxinus gammacytorhabdovirus 2]
MFITNLSVQIKSSLKLKKYKISNYGQAGEFKATDWKTRVYLINPPKKNKYAEICSMNISWVPTLSHLLEGCAITLRIKDRRGNSNNSQSNELLLLRKDASVAWDLNIPCSLSIPINELSSGLPLSFDIDVSSNQVKSGHEMGVLKISANVLSSRDVTPFSIGTPSFRYNKKTDIPGDIITWKGMTIPSDNNGTSSMIAAVSRYLDGNMTLTELGYVLSNKLSVS